MTTKMTHCAAPPRHPGTVPYRNPEAAGTVASGLRDTKAENTRRAYASTWHQFASWAEAGGHPVLSATPQTVALYIRHLIASGKSLAAVQQIRSTISHHHATPQGAEG